MSEYRPIPIDTDQITLSDELTALIEMLAESAHDNWSLQRMGEGWRRNALTGVSVHR